MMKLRNIMRTPHGATPAEYMVMLVLTALFIIAIVRVFGSTVSNKVYEANYAMDNLEAKEKAAAKDGKGGGTGSGLDANGKPLKGSKDGAGKNGKEGQGSGANGKKAGYQGSDGDGKGKDGKGGKGKKDGDAEGGIGEEDGGGGILGIGGSKRGEEGKGINPLVLLAALVLVGFLVYAMVGKKKGK